MGRLLCMYLCVYVCVCGGGGGGVRWLVGGTLISLILIVDLPALPKRGERAYALR